MKKKEVRHILPYLSPSEMLKYFNDKPINDALNGEKTSQSTEIKFLSTWDYLGTIPHKFLYHPKYISLYHNTALKIVRKLISEGLLSPVGTKSGIYQELQGNSYDQDKMHNKNYDFLVYGFGEIVDHFKDAIRIIEVKDNKTGDVSAGTGFAILYDYNKQYFITAKHCLPKDSEIALKIFLGFGDNYAYPENIYIHKDEKVDIAVLEFSEHNLLSDHFFHLEHPYLLQNILVSGYPPIPGTNDAVLVSSTGEITAIANTYFHKYEQIYVNANIKGGSSGSPIINAFGNVVGIIIESARDIKNIELQDELRFGTGLVSELIYEILESINKGGENHKKINFKIKENNTFEPQ